MKYSPLRPSVDKVNMCTTVQLDFRFSPTYFNDILIMQQLGEKQLILHNLLLPLLLLLVVVIIVVVNCSCSGAVTYAKYEVFFVFYK